MSNVMKNVNEQLLKVMHVVQERAELNPKGTTFVLHPDLFVDCPDYEPLMEKLAHEYKAIDIKQRPDEQHLDYDQLAVIEGDLTDYYSYRLTLTSSFEPILHTLSNNDTLQAPATPTSDPDTAQCKVTFDYKTSTLSYGDKTCEIPEGSLEYYVCKLAVNKGVAKEQNIIDANDSNSDTPRAVYDAMGRINKKVADSLGIDKLLIWKAGKVRVSKKYL